MLITHIGMYICRFMRGALNNPRDILRSRRDRPLTTLGTWKLNNSRRKEQIFDQPLLTGKLACFPACDTL